MVFAHCPHCGEYRTVRSGPRPDDIYDEPCDGCDEFDAKLDYIVEVEAA